MGLLDAPAPQKITCLVCELSMDKVKVMRLGGGLGESSMAATNVVNEGGGGGGAVTRA